MAEQQITIRLSEEQLAKLDARVGERTTRSAWIRELIDQGLQRSAMRDELAAQRSEIEALRHGVNTLLETQAHVASEISEVRNTLRVVVACLPRNKDGTYFRIMAAPETLKIEGRLARWIPLTGRILNVGAIVARRSRRSDTAVP